MEPETRRGIGVGTSIWIALFLVVLLVALARGLGVVDLVVWLLLTTGWVVYWWKSHRLRTVVEPGWHRNKVVGRGLRWLGRFTP